MSKDEFRCEQKAMCPSFSSGCTTYGCECCRVISNLNRFKKVSRRLAKVRFRRHTQEMIRDEQYDI
jgi:hypothetical protein